MSLLSSLSQLKRIIVYWILYRNRDNTHSFVSEDRGQKITGLEIQSEIADMAQRSVDGNNLGSLIDIVKGDIRQAISILAGDHTILW